MKKNYKVWCDYKDTCFSDYLQDHHNRDGECLLGISTEFYNKKFANDEVVQRGESFDAIVYAKDEAAHALMLEINIGDFGIPSEITDEQLCKAFNQAVEGVDFRYIDENGNRVSEENMPEERYSEEPMIWFVLYWEETNNEDE